MDPGNGNSEADQFQIIAPTILEEEKELEESSIITWPESENNKLQIKYYGAQFDGEKGSNSNPIDFYLDLTMQGDKVQSERKET